MKRTAKPAPVGVVNGAFAAKLQVISEKTGRWETVGECADTPNAIQKALKELKLKNVWCYSGGCRRPLF